MEVWSHYWSLGCVGFDPAVREMLLMVSEPIGNLLDHSSSYILILLWPPHNSSSCFRCITSNKLGGALGSPHPSISEASQSGFSQWFPTLMCGKLQDPCSYYMDEDETLSKQITPEG